MNFKTRGHTFWVKSSTFKFKAKPNYDYTLNQYRLFTPKTGQAVQN